MGGHHSLGSGRCSLCEQGLSGSGSYLSCQNNYFLFVSGSAGQLAFGKGLSCGWWGGRRPILLLPQPLTCCVPLGRSWAPPLFRPQFPPLRNGRVRAREYKGYFCSHGKQFGGSQGQRSGRRDIVFPCWGGNATLALGASGFGVSCSLEPSTSPCKVIYVSAGTPAHPAHIPCTVFVVPCPHTADEKIETQKGLRNLPKAPHLVRG